MCAAPKKQSPLQEIWHSKIGYWLDFRKYLRQRTRILRSPELVFDPPDDDDDWKSPLAFAVQGLVLVAVIVSLLDGVLGTFLTAPAPYWKEQEKAILADIAEYQAKVQSTDEQESFAIMYPGDLMFPAEVSKETYEAFLRQQISILEGQLAYVRMTPDRDKASGVLDKFLMPVTLLLAAYLFRCFLKLGLGKRASHCEGAHIAYLYIFTAAMFWPNFVYILAVAVLRNVFTYIPDFAARPESAVVLPAVPLAAIAWIQYIAIKLRARFQKLFRLTAKQGVIMGDEKVGNSLFWAGLVTFVCVIVTMILLSHLYAYGIHWIDQMKGPGP